MKRSPLKRKTPMQRKRSTKQRIKRRRKAERDYLAQVAELGCWICARPAEIHHIREGYGMAQRAPDWDVIPLCPAHHREGPEAYHSAPRIWRKQHGSEIEIAATVREIITGSREMPGETP